MISDVNLAAVPFHFRYYNGIPPWKEFHHGRIPPFSLTSCILRERDGHISLPFQFLFVFLSIQLPDLAEDFFSKENAPFR